MRWQGGRRSSNVEDRRGMGGGMAAGGGIGAVVIGLIYFFLTGDPSAVSAPGAGGAAPPPGSAAAAEEDSLAQFVEVVLAHTEDTWRERFAESGSSYRDPRLVLFSGSVNSACGSASAAVGPFYCPSDERVYIDLSFYRDLRRQLGAPGDFAQAYVIAHEVGHHVQTLTGISEQVHAARRRSSEAEGNRLSVLQELQADCYAGVFAHDAAQKNLLEPGDVEEALTAASAIGDDNLQQQQQGYVVPESFTHGTSEQRMRWFRTGLESGDASACDTFADGGV